MPGVKARENIWNSFVTFAAGMGAFWLPSQPANAHGVKARGTMSAPKIDAKYAMGLDGHIHTNPAFRVKQDLRSKLRECQLILVRHSVPEIDPTNPARLWALSAEGGARCSSLAEIIRAYRMDYILASVEPKAQETASLLAEALCLPWQTVDGLHEHERPNIPFFPTPDDFQTAISTFFRNPDTLVFGTETAAQALMRFQAAIETALSEHPQKNVIIVSHGTVISLFLAHCTGGDAFEIWQNLKLPDYFVLPSFSHES